jgi:hypothetical protein
VPHSSQLHRDEWAAADPQSRPTLYSGYVRTSLPHSTLIC